MNPYTASVVLLPDSPRLYSSFVAPLKVVGDSGITGLYNHKNTLNISKLQFFKFCASLIATKIIPELVKQHQLLKTHEKKKPHLKIGL